MDGERWNRAKEIFGDAYLLRGVEREHLLEVRCEGDAALRAEVEELLAQYDGQPAFLSTPAAVLAGECLEPPPEQLGAYRIVRPVGSGGMADVYLGERSDGSFEKQVAVKVMKFGLLDPAARRRFDQERQLAAWLDHPNIARLLDGGVTPDGRPYFVMDYVDGAPLAEWSATASELERLRLFVKICRAVEYVHGRGVVHRDLKPGNILVTREGEPVLLDFGISKLLEPVESTDGATRTAFRPFTPEYASPEQMRGLPTGPASDIYSLGLLLYGLAAPAVPVAGPRRVELERLPRWLARIVARATAEAPGDRFPSAAALGAAVERRMASPPWDLPRLPGRWKLGVLLGTVALALLGWAVWRSRPSSATPPPAPREGVLLTTGEDSEETPTLSPDATRIAFARPQQGIFIRPVDGGPETKVTAPPPGLRDCCPSWSPDNQWIAFERAAPGTRYDLFVVPAKGGETRTITDAESPGLGWTADSGFVAFSDRDGPEDPFVVHRASVMSGRREALTAPPPGSWGDKDAKFSPDGKKLAFARYSAKGNADVYVSDASGGNPRKVADVGTWVNGIDWTPDNQGVVFGTCLKLCGLYWVDTTKPGAAPIPIATNFIPTQPSVGKTAGGTERIVFNTAGVDLNLRGATRDYPEREPGRVTDTTRGNEVPAFSPDGRSLAFLSHRTGHSEFWVANADGSDPRQITTGGAAGTLYQPLGWSPDGRFLAVSTNQYGKAAIYVVALADGGMHRLTRDAAEEGNPSWSRDGKYIYFRSDRSGSPRIWKMAANGTGAPIPVSQGIGSRALESADGAVLYFTRNPDAGPLWSVPPSGGQEVELPRSPTIFAHCWTVASEGIFYWDMVDRSQPDKVALRLFRPKQGARELIRWTPAHGARFESLTATGDGRAFVWAARYVKLDLRKIDGFR